MWCGINRCCLLLLETSRVLWHAGTHQYTHRHKVNIHTMVVLLMNIDRLDFSSTYALWYIHCIKLYMLSVLGQ